MSVADLQIATDAETKIRAEMKEIEDTENVFSHSENIYCVYVLYTLA